LTVALIDGDIIAYRAAFIASDTYEDTTIYDPFVVDQTVTHLVDQWTKKAKAGVNIVCLSDPTHRYFRHTIYPEYKANRQGKERPAALGLAYESLKAHYKCEWREGLEADDVIGILAGDERLTDPVMVSIDKDLMTVPGKLLNPDKMNRAMRIRKPAADRFIFKQALMGDRTDNYPGVEGIGEVKATRIVESHPRLSHVWEAVVEAFSGDYKRALTMTRLARILRHEDYDSHKGRVRLWDQKNGVWQNAKPMKLKGEKKTMTAKKSSTKQKKRSAKTGTKAMANRKKTQKGSPKGGRKYSG